MPISLITTSAVAQRLGVNPATVARMVSSGRLVPVAKAPGLRGAYLFDPADVDRVARERAQVTA